MLRSPAHEDEPLKHLRQRSFVLNLPDCYCELILIRPPLHHQFEGAYDITGGIRVPNRLDKVRPTHVRRQDVDDFELGEVERCEPGNAPRAILISRQERVQQVVELSLMNDLSSTAERSPKPLDVLSMSGDEDAAMIRSEQETPDLRHVGFKRRVRRKVGTDDLPPLRTDTEELAAEAGAMTVDLDDHVERPLSV